MAEQDKNHVAPSSQEQTPAVETEKRKQKQDAAQQGSDPESKSKQS
jgi:hypothetical protein